MKKVYKVRLASRFNSIALFCILCILFFLAAKLFIPTGGLHNSLLSITFAISYFLFAYFLWRIFVMARTEWVIDETGISVNWTKKLVLPEKDFTLQWKDILEIRKRWSGGQYDILKIKLASGEAMKFYHDISTIRDDFKALMKELNQSMNEGYVTRTDND